MAAVTRRRAPEVQPLTFGGVQILLVRDRMRPILLTAAAASLGLLPIAREIFWGPMAYAMMGGIIVGTVLTLLFLPALYVAWFRIKKEQDHASNGASELVQRAAYPNAKAA
jgi:hypothetical protein